MAAPSEQFASLDVNDKMVQEYATEVMQLRHNLAVTNLRFVAALEEIDRLHGEIADMQRQEPAEKF